MANGGIIGPVNTISPRPAVKVTQINSSGCHTLESTTTSVDFVAVAAGGGGGGNQGGGGGAGGVLKSICNACLSAISVTGGTDVPVTINGGGSGGGNSGPGQGTDGGSTVVVLGGTTFTAASDGVAAL